MTIFLESNLANGDTCALETLGIHQNTLIMFSMSPNWYSHLHVYFFYKTLWIGFAASTYPRIIPNSLMQLSASLNECTFKFNRMKLLSHILCRILTDLIHYLSAAVIKVSSATIDTYNWSITVTMNNAMAGFYVIGLYFM